MPTRLVKILGRTHYHVVCNQSKISKKLYTVPKSRLIWGEQIAEYCKKDCNSIAIPSWKKILQSVLQYFFHQVLLLLLQYILPVLLATLTIDKLKHSRAYDETGRQQQ